MSDLHPTSTPARGSLTPTVPATWDHEVVLAPLTRGGNLPFRRLCLDYGARITFGEMAYAHQLLRKVPKELALLRRHADEPCFGVQIAGNKAGKLSEAAQMAEAAGADLIDLNCGCPIHDTTRRGMGASLLQRPSRLGRLLEAMVQAVSVPVTVKIRIGWSAAKINVHEVCRLAEEAGVAAITIHGRTREQRYSRAADWALIGQVAEERGVPVVGNGDVSTWYEAEDRRTQHGVQHLMLARGALIKPWLFRDIATGTGWCPSAEDRVGVARTWVRYAKEHFGDDEKGERKAMYFLPWHLELWGRYRHSPAAAWREASQEHPILNTRRSEPTDDPLEEVLRTRDVPTHERMAKALWHAPDDAAACDALRAVELPAPEDVVTRKGRSPEG